MTGLQENAFSLQGKVALITGGASGMGRASSLLFAAHGAHVIIVDRNQEAMQEAAEAIRAQGGTAETYVVDLLDQAALDAFIESFAATHEVVDVLFNHAGLPAPAGFDYDLASFTQCMTINVWVPMHLTKQLLPQLRRSKAASVICTSSQAGLRAPAPFPTYAASKAAINQYIKSIALLLAHEGIRANTICPGATDTPALRRDIEDGTVKATIEQIAQYVPMKKLGTPQDIAHLALFLASDASAFMTGCAIPIDGGASA